jgi:hypothetical protein
MQVETTKPGLAPGSAFVLVEWCSILLQEIRAEQWDIWGLQMIENNARALELCLSESSRSNVKHSALVVTRRGLRKLFSIRASGPFPNGQKPIEEAIQKLSSKGPQPSAKNAVMLGVIAGVCSRHQGAKRILAGKKSEFYTFYIREIIGSRNQVPAHISNALDDFFVAFTTSEDLEKEVIPALEKALLRAPEIVLNDLVTPLFHSLPDSIDLSNILLKNLLKPLLSNVKSTNPTIRQGALSAFKAAVLKCHNKDLVEQIADEILTPLKSGKLSSADQRATHADMLAALPISKSTVAKVSPAIAVVAGKEANEAALSSETAALLHYLSWGINNGVDLDKQVVDTFVKGISDKKLPVKKLWVVRLGNLFGTTNDQEVLKSKLAGLAESAMPAFLDIWQDTNTNAISAAQSGLVTGAYVLTAISQNKLALLANARVEAGLKKAQVSQQALAIEPKPSFLLNHRIYSKLTNEDDFKWFIQALASVLPDLAAVERDSAIAVGWSQAIIFCICSSTVPPVLRREASQTLSKLYLNNPTQVSKIVVAGLWRWRNSVESSEKDSAAATAKTDNQNLHLVLKAICLAPASIARLGGQVGEAVRKDQMMSLLVLARPELLPRVSWIDLCLTVEVDPGDLARSSGESLLQQILDCTTFNNTVRTEGS